MKLVADDAIVLVDAYFGEHFTIERYPSEAITPKVIQDADVLLTRSTRQVNQALLANSTVRCVATTTSGFDHIDTAYCDANGIAWFHAKGCNAPSVADYVVACLARLTIDGCCPTLNRIAVIGVGEVGQRVADRLRFFCDEILLCDPPRGQREPGFASVDLASISDCDLICIHTPLTFDEHPTYKMIDADFLQRQKPGCLLLNAGRGDVVDAQAVLQSGQHLDYCLDVFPGEPAIDSALVNSVRLATPHIAGHAIEGKWRGTWMAYEKIRDFYRLPSKRFQTPILAPTIMIDAQDSWASVILKMYDPHVDHVVLQQSLSSDDPSGQFNQYRKQYPIRHEFSYHSLEGQLASGAMHERMITQLF